MFVRPRCLWRLVRPRWLWRPYMSGWPWSGSFLREVLGDVRDFGVHLLLIGGPALGAPDLEPIVGADDHAGSLTEAGVLDQLLRQPDAPGGVERVVEGAAVEVATHHSALAAQRIGLAQEALGEALRARGREH